MRYYHGSSFLTASGTVLQGRGHAYEKEWGGTDFYTVLEAYRPAACIPHKEAVFMCADEDIDSCGGSLDIIYELEPLGNVTRHDMNWSSEISCLLGGGATASDPRVVAAAQAYWNGVPHHNEQVWEYLTRSARVLRICEDNRDPVPLKTGAIDSGPEI